MTTHHDDTDAPSGVLSGPQTPEHAQPIVGDGYRVSEPVQGPLVACERNGIHNRCAVTGGWANHDAGLTAHDMPTPRTTCTLADWHPCPDAHGMTTYHAWIKDGE